MAECKDSKRECYWDQDKLVAFGRMEQQVSTLVKKQEDQWEKLEKIHQAVERNTSGVGGRAMAGATTGGFLGGLLFAAAAVLAWLKSFGGE